jgi:alpha-beta hydrolase superfamily lysophospholipase
MARSFLLIHGMCCTGSVWKNFQRFYEERGVRVFAPTLRPELRTRRRPSKGLHALRLADYEADVEQELARIEQLTGGPVTVIGHSMGGLLAQTLAERNRPNAAVFISPTPPADVRTPYFTRFWSRFRTVRSLGLVPRALYPYRFATDYLVFNRVPHAERAAAHAEMVHEAREVFADFDSRHIDEAKIEIPVLTIAATRDRLVTADVVRLTAQKYERVGGHFKEYREHGHWLYGEPGWERPAADILAWVEAHT